VPHGGRAAYDPIRRAVTAIHADPGARHDIAGLAAHAGLSPRHLQRRLTTELGIPPAAYVERVRVEAAQRALETRPEDVPEPALVDQSAPSPA
jgi:transcriptional regulator GlxA family with amidase domain